MSDKPKTLREQVLAKLKSRYCGEVSHTLREGWEQGISMTEIVWREQAEALVREMVHNSSWKHGAHAHFTESCFRCRWAALLGLEE